MEIETRTVPAIHLAPPPFGSVEWLNRNRKAIVIAVVSLIVAVVVIVAAVMLYNYHSNKASAAFGGAMHTYETPLATDTPPAPPGSKTFATQAERAKAAYPQFVAVADAYSHTPAGRNALYLSGVTANESGQTAIAEAKLKEAASGMSKDDASLAKLALANLYQQTNRDADAIKLYTELTDKPTTMIPAGLAQLQLADLYAATGKTDQAKKIYAQLKDKDAKSVVGAVASQKLSGGPTR